MTHPVPLDRRLLAGLSVTVKDLVAVFIDHRPGQAAACGTCWHRYTMAAPLCPTGVLVRELLKRRRYEDPKAVESIKAELNQRRDDRVLPDEPAPDVADVPETGEMFAIDPAWRKPKHRATHGR
jgi:hypothetical protein